MEPSAYFFGALFLFVGVMLVKSMMPRRMPGPGRLREKISPQLRTFIDSLPLPADHPLADFCQPWKATEDQGYSKAQLPLWQARNGEPSYISTYIKWGSSPTFHGNARTENEQAFLGALTLRVLGKSYDSDRPQALANARRAADAVGFRYFDEAAKFMAWWTNPEPLEFEGAVDTFVEQIEKIEKG
jgi:hypothetical protein